MSVAVSIILVIALALLNMPWRELLAAYSDEELRAIYVNLRTLPAG